MMVWFLMGCETAELLKIPSLPTIDEMTDTISKPFKKTPKPKPFTTQSDMATTSDSDVIEIASLESGISSLNPEQLYEQATHMCCGAGTQYNNKLAYRYLCFAAKENHIPSQIMLGDLYQNGINFNYTGPKLEAFVLAQDIPRAFMWYSIAAKHQNNKAIKRKNELKETMNQDQLNQAFEQLRFWKRIDCEKE